MTFIQTSTPPEKSTVTTFPSYDASSIKVLRGLEAVRERPGMYIGDVTSSEGLHHAVKEVVDNAIDEVLAGYATTVLVEIGEDGSCIVADNGRGIPVDMHAEEGVSAAEVIMTRLHAGGKFNRGSYKVSGGLHGVGVSVVNALSSWLTLYIHRNNRCYFMEFRKGDAVAPLRDIGPSDRQGTEVRFLPDPEIFMGQVFNADIITKRLEELAYLNKGLDIRFVDNRTKDKKHFLAKGGVCDFVQDLSAGSQSVLSTVISFEAERDAVDMNVAFTWLDQEDRIIRCFTNNIPQQLGGTHLTGFYTGLSNAMNAWKKQAFEGGKEPVFSNEDLQEGLVVVLSIKIPDAKFASQTKEKLISAEVRVPISTMIGEMFEEWLQTHPDQAQTLIEHARRAAYVREAQRKAREAARRQPENESLGAAEKLADCHSKDPNECELFLVEGDSAGGSAKQGRDRQYQAILPLRGKILNVARVDFNKMMDSREVKAIVQSMRCGIATSFNMDNLRYGRVIIMTDADVDGSHIRCLLLTLFFLHFRPLVENGHIFVADPPLYKLIRKGSKTYPRDDAALTKALISAASDEVRMEIDGDTLTGPALEEWLNLLRPAADLIGKLEQEGLPIVLADALAATGALKHIENLPKILPLLAMDEEASWRVDVEGAYRTSYGVEESFLLKDFNNSPTFKNLTNQNIHTLPWIGRALKIGANWAIGPYSIIQAAVLVGRAKATIQRYKGLGEMNPDELWATTLNPEERIIKRITIEDAEAALQSVENLMFKDTAGRKTLLEELDPANANLDV